MSDNRQKTEYNSILDLPEKDKRAALDKIGKTEQEFRNSEAEIEAGKVLNDEWVKDHPDAKPVFDDRKETFTAVKPGTLESADDVDLEEFLKDVDNS